MATVTLPCRTDLKLYEFQAELEGTTYGFRFYWLEREGAWYFDLNDADGVSLKAGVKVVLDFPLFARGSRTGVPPGLMVAVDTGLNKEPPGVTDLGGRVQVLYTEAE